LDNGLKAKVLFEIGQIDKLLEGSKPLLDLCRLKVPDFIEMSAAALLVHSFYNGIENILVLIFKHSGETLPAGNKWHVELLEKAFSKTAERQPVFKIELQETLEEYLKFRHFIRHVYGFQLEWERMEGLITKIMDTWKTVKENIQDFIA
jgi:hypothetical protein